MSILVWTFALLQCVKLRPIHKIICLIQKYIFMKVIKTEIRFKTGFQQPKTGFPKNPVLTSLNWNIEKKSTYA